MKNNTINNKILKNNSKTKLTQKLSGLLLIINSEHDSNNIPTFNIT